MRDALPSKPFSEATNVSRCRRLCASKTDEIRGDLFAHLQDLETPVMTVQP